MRFLSASFAGVLLAAMLLVSGGYSQTIKRPAPAQQQTPRILVKIRPALAQQIEAELPAQGPPQAMAIVRGQATHAGVQRFIGRYSPRSLTPLYPDMIRLRQQQGWSDADLANHLRQQFPLRSARQPHPLTTPEISRTYVLEFPGVSTRQVDILLQQLQADPDVEFAEPDRIATTSDLPNDPFLSSSGTWGQSYQDLWGHYKINAPAAWSANFFGDGIIVAVVDTGIDYNHADISTNVIKGLDFIGASCFNPVQGTDPIDHFGHGTHVAGTIGALGNNGIGIIGIAWHAKVMAVKGLDDFGCGLESTLAPAINYAANNGADIINASWGGQGASQVIEEAIQFAYGLGVVFVAAAGNSSEDALNFFPANSPEAITVAASDAFDNFAFFSNFGSKIDVTAPGVDVLSLRAAGSNIGFVVGTDYMRLDGTSMAAPHVAGTAALILSQHPAYTPEDVRQAIRASASNSSGWDPQFGYGIVNAQAALALPSVLDVHLTSPLGGTPVNSVTTISGIAQGANFDHYVLEVGAGLAPTVWTQLQTGTTQVNGGPLGTFDPGTVPDGIYTIRLTAFDSANHSFSDRLELVVDFLAISSPSRPAVPSVAAEFKPGVLLSITGKAIGATFKDFQLQWAEGIFPSSGWSSMGITLVGGGQTSVSSGALGTWDTTSITNADYYTIRLLVDNAGFTSETDTLIYLEPDLLSANWPQALDQAPDFQSGFIPVTDTSGNTSLSLINPIYLGSFFPGQLLKFAPEGLLQSTTQLSFGSHFNPAAGEMEGRPGQEIVISDEENGIVLFRPDNTSFNFKPSPNLGPISLSDSQVVLAELEQNSELDVVAVGNQFETQTAYLFAWRRDGSLLNAAFPVSIPDQNFNLSDGANPTPRVYVGDVNGDGMKEFVVVEGTSSSTFKLGLFAADGTPLSWLVPEMDGFPLSIVLADLDHNGKLETLVVTSSNFQTSLHVFQPDGTERTGWPQMLDGFGFNMAVGDLDHSGKEEIIVPGLLLLYVFNPDGTSFSDAWPQSGNQRGHLALADIDGDGFPEILVMEFRVSSIPNQLSPNTNGAAIGKAPRPEVTVKKEASSTGRIQRRVSVNSNASSLGSIFYQTPALVALRRDGTQVKSWNLLGTAGNQPFYDAAITVGDFNRDGTTDIALSYFTVDGGGLGGFLTQGTATVLSTGTHFDSNVNDWPMMYHDPRNTSVQRRDLTPPTISMTSPANGTQVGGPVTLAATATDDIGVTGVQFLVDGVNLGTPVTVAPFTVTWDSTAVASGLHMLTALARDAAGHSTVSAPVGVTVTALPDFSVVASPATATIKAGSSATLSLTVNPMNGFNGTVTFSCSGLPAEAQCSFAPSSITPNGSPVSTTLTITTTSSAALLAPPAQKNNLPLYASLWGISGMLWIACGNKRRRSAKTGLLLSIIALSALAGLAGCGGGGAAVHHDPGTPQGTSLITVNSSAGSNSKTVPITLTVQ